MQYSVDTDQTAPEGAVWSGSALFAQTCLPQSFEFLWYSACLCIHWTYQQQFSYVGLFITVVDFVI